MRAISPPKPAFDGLAIGISAACLVHCLGLPLLFAVLPALSAAFDIPEAFHVAMFASAVPVSAIALNSGFRHHGALLPVLFGAIGLALLGAGALAGQPELIETGLTVAGGLALAGAHWQNWRLRRAATALLVDPA